MKLKVKIVIVYEVNKKTNINIKFMKPTTFEFRAKSGKREYALWLDVEDYHNRIIVMNNKVTISGKDIKFNKNSHKDWFKAFMVDESDEYNTTIVFKKGAFALTIERLDKWKDNRSLIMIEGSNI